MQADPTGARRERVAAYRTLVAQLLGLNVHDKQAVRQLAADVLRVTGGPTSLEVLS